MVSRFFYNSQKLINRKQTSILSAAAVLMLTVFLSRILGLVRDRFLAGAFFSPETAWQLDVYFAAFRLPDMIFQLLVVGALSAAFIPVFSQYLIKDKKEAWHVASTVISFGTIGFLVLAGLLIVFAQNLSRLIAPSFSPVQLSLMVNLTRLLVLAQFSFLVSSFLTGMLQSHHHFIVPSLAPIAYNLGIIFGILVLALIFGIFGPAIGVLLGAFLHLLIQLPLTRSIGFRFNFSLDYKHPGVRRIGRLMLPRTLALAVSQVELTLAVFIATALPAGSLAIFYFAQHLNSLPVGLFGATIGQAALPSLSRVTLEDLQKFKVLLIASLNQVFFLSLPAGMILLILRVPAVRLAFGTANFPWQATLLTGRVVALFAISVFAQSAVQILVRGFYAMSNTKTPLFLGGFSVLLNVGLSLMFVYRFGLGVMGLALGISIASFIQAALLFTVLLKKLGGASFSEFWLPFLKMTLSTLLTGLALWLPMRFLDRYLLDTARTLDLIVLSTITTVIGLGVYAVLSKIFKVAELNGFIDLLNKVRHLKSTLKTSEAALEPTLPLSS